MRLSHAAPLIFAAALLPGGVTHADSITLRAAGEVAGEKVLLRDIADLDGPAATALGDLPVARLLGHEQATPVNLSAVRAALDTRNVNWGKLTLRGRIACNVRFSAPPATQPAPGVADAAAVGGGASANLPVTLAVEPPAAVANPGVTVDPVSPLTLRDLVAVQLAKFAGASRDDLRFNFSRSDQEALGTGVLRDRFEFEPLTGSPIGPVRLIVRQWRGEQTVATFRMTVDVARRCLAVSATHDVARGQTFAPDDLEIREIFLTDARRTPLTSRAAPLGQVCQNALHKGSIVFADDLAPPVVVSRGEVITVHATVGTLMIKVPARAMEPGAVGQVIQVTNESSREKFSAKITGPREATLPSSDTTSPADPRLTLERRK